MRTLLVTFLLCCSFFGKSLFGQADYENGYLQKSGRYFANDAGRILLKSLNVGGWMLQEGYMMHTSKTANAQHELEAKISELVGESSKNKFYDAWLNNHCTKRDIDSMAAWGFNSIRLPMHYKLFTPPIEEEPIQGEITWHDKGFTMVDSMVAWCKVNQLYLILDLHAAPGGQGTDVPIADYDKSKPSLWESELNKEKTKALWLKLAKRYANEPTIGGYDLLNETNWAFEGKNIHGCSELGNEPLKAFLVELTEAIRIADTTHLIFIEGNCWANNFEGIWPPWDDKLVLSFHKYWSFNTQESIQKFVALAEKHELPLYLGESGENSNVWFTEAIRLFEQNEISWAWWPMKKIESITNPCSIVLNDGYQDILDYWRTGDNKPPSQIAFQSLMQLAENTKIQNCTIRYDLIDALFRQVNDASPQQFKLHAVPGVIKAVDFDMGQLGSAYSDADTMNVWVSTGNRTDWNQGWAYRNDAVDIRYSETQLDYVVDWTEHGEWMNYTFEVSELGEYEFSLMFSGRTGAASLFVDGEKNVGFIKRKKGKKDYWLTDVVGKTMLSKGAHVLTLKVDEGGLAYSDINVKLLKE